MSCELDLQGHLAMVTLYGITIYHFSKTYNLVVSKWYPYLNCAILDFEEATEISTWWRPGLKPMVPLRTGLTLVMLPVPGGWYLFLVPIQFTSKGNYKWTVFKLGYTDVNKRPFIHRCWCLPFHWIL